MISQHKCKHQLDTYLRLYLFGDTHFFFCVLSGFIMPRVGKSHGMVCVGHKLKVNCEEEKKLRNVCKKNMHIQKRRTRKEDKPTGNFSTRRSICNVYV